MVGDVVEVDASWTVVRVGESEEGVCFSFVAHAVSTKVRINKLAICEC
jgi:hypothetical protein